MNQPKPFDYHAFIHELRQHHNQSENFDGRQRSPDHQIFKVWRHDLAALINRINGLGYQVNCGIAHRAFDIRAAYAAVSAAAKEHQFNQDLEDTWIETRAILEDYEKYGDPKTAISAKQAEATANSMAEPKPKAPLKWDKEATFKWYWENTPAGVLWKAALTLAAVFASGLGVGFFLEKRLPEVQKLRQSQELAPMPILKSSASQPNTPVTGTTK